MMSEINYLHNEGCQNKRLNMNCHSLKVRNKEIHSLSDLNMKVNEFAKRIIFINK